VAGKEPKVLFRCARQEDPDSNNGSPQANRPHRNVSAVFCARIGMRQQKETHQHEHSNPRGPLGLPQHQNRFRESGSSPLEQSRHLVDPLYGPPIGLHKTTSSRFPRNTKSARSTTTAKYPLRPSGGRGNRNHLTLMEGAQLLTRVAPLSISSAGSSPSKVERTRTPGGQGSGAKRSAPDRHHRGSSALRPRESMRSTPSPRRS